MSATIFFPENWQGLTGYDYAHAVDDWMLARGFQDFEREHEIWPTESDAFARVCFCALDLDKLKTMADVAESNDIFLLRAPTRYTYETGGSVWITEPFSAYSQRSYGDLENLSKLDTTPLTGRDAFHAWGEASKRLVFVPSLCSGSDYIGGSLTRSNFRVFADKFKSSKAEKWWELYGGHGTYAIAIALDCADAGMVEFFEGLADYPSADDDELCEVEREAEDEAWENWIRSDFTRALKARFPELEDLINDTEDGDARQWLALGMERANEYFEHEEGGSVFVRLEKVVSALKAEDLQGAE